MKVNRPMQWLTLLACGVAVLIAGVVSLRALFSFDQHDQRQAAQRAQTKRAVASAQDLYRDLGALVSLDRRDEAASRLRQGIRAAAPPELDAALADALADEFAHLLPLLLGPSPEAYAADRLASGYRWKPVSELNMLDIEGTLAVRKRDPFPGWDDPTSVFAAMSRSARAWKGPINQPVGIVMGEGLFGAAAFEISADKPLRGLTPQELVPASRSDLTNALWSVQWLLPPRDPKDIIAAEGRAHAAAAACLVEYADGSRRPLQITFVWDRTAQRWFATRLAVSAGDALEVCGIEF